MNKKDLRIVYLGTPEISATVLKKMISNGYNIVCVVSQADKPIGRKQILTATPVKKVALENNIEVFQPQKIRENYSFLYDFKPDILLTMAYGQLIPHDMLEIPTIKSLNLHGSDLPKYRGASPIQASLLNGDLQTAVTLMEMVDEMDAGNMFYKKYIDIDEDDNYDTLQEKIAEAAYLAFDEGIDTIINDNYQGEKQDVNLVSFTKKIKPEDQKINFNVKSNEIVNKIRALTSDPGAYFVYNNQIVKVQKALSVKVSCDKEPGTIIDFNNKGLIVKTLDGAVSIVKLQKSGKKAMEIKDFYNGSHDYFKIGDILNV